MKELLITSLLALTILAPLGFVALREEIALAAPPPPPPGEPELDWTITIE